MQQETGRKESRSNREGRQAGGGERKEARRGSQGWRKAKRHPLPTPPSGYLEAPQALSTSILGVWKKKGSTSGQGGRKRMTENDLSLELQPPSTSQHVCLEKYPC